MSHSGMNAGDPARVDFLRDFWCAGESRKIGLTSEDVYADELERGIEVEMEHTTDPEIAEKIALDHLAEYENYYRGLDFVELLMEVGLLEEAIELTRTHLGIQYP